MKRKKKWCYYCKKYLEFGCKHFPNMTVDMTFIQLNYDGDYRINYTRYFSKETEYYSSIEEIRVRVKQLKFNGIKHIEVQRRVKDNKTYRIYSVSQSEWSNN